MFLLAVTSKVLWPRATPSRQRQGETQREGRGKRVEDTERGETGKGGNTRGEGREGEGRGGRDM